MRYLVETYHASATDPATSVATAMNAAAATVGSAHPVRHLESIVIPDDEVCLHLFEAQSLSDLHRALADGRVAFERIVHAATTSGADR